MTNPCAADQSGEERVKCLALELSQVSLLPKAADTSGNASGAGSGVRGGGEKEGKQPKGRKSATKELKPGTSEEVEDHMTILERISRSQIFTSANFPVYGTVKAGKSAITCLLKKVLLPEQSQTTTSLLIRMNHVPEGEIPFVIQQHREWNKCVQRFRKTLEEGRLKAPIEDGSDSGHDSKAYETQEKIRRSDLTLLETTTETDVIRTVFDNISYFVPLLSINDITYNKENGINMEPEYFPIVQLSMESFRPNCFKELAFLDTLAFHEPQTVNQLEKIDIIKGFVKSMKAQLRSVRSILFPWLVLLSGSHGGAFMATASTITWVLTSATAAKSSKLRRTCAPCVDSRNTNGCTHDWLACSCWPYCTYCDTSVLLSQRVPISRAKASSCWIHIVMMMMLTVLSLCLRGAEGGLGGDAQKGLEEVSDSTTAIDANTACKISVEEYDALYDLFNATDGAHWAWGPPDAGAVWNFTAQSSLEGRLGHPCGNYWQGITCETLSGSNCTIIELALASYNLTGSIPSSIGRMSGMAFLDLEANILTGTIPSSLGLLTAMQYLLDSNSLTGTIPSSLGQLSTLSLVLSSNSLTGTIPTALRQIYFFSYFFLYSNSLTGTIPSWIGSQQGIHQLALGDNLFTGSIPSTFGLPSMQGDENNNYYYFSHSPEMNNMNLGSNYLTGTIPSSLGLLLAMVYLDVSSNMLTGSIPLSLGNVTNIQFFCFSMNSLTGSIPAFMGKFPSLISLHLDSNSLTGTIPPGVGNSAALAQILINDNHLEGNIAIAITAKMVSLTVLDVRDNAFTGSLPTNVFLSPSIQVFAAVGNCFSGTLPAEICRAGSLQTLILDGLSTSPSCRSSYFHHLKGPRAYTLQRAVTGTIPSCLFELVNLSTLHLSGNRFTGTLPNQAHNISISLRDLSLGYNQLTGPIPEVFQMHEWLNLDLSSNRFSGTLAPSFRMINDSSNSNIAVSLFLEKNFLSGDIPPTLRDVASISILSGNVFGCNIDRLTLPVSDAQYSSYQCGSTNLNISLFLWLVLFTLIALLAWALPHEKVVADLKALDMCRMVFKLIRAMNMARIQSLINYFERCSSEGGGGGGELRALLRWLRFISIVLGGVCVCVLLPLYGALNGYYSDYAIPYAWVLSVTSSSGFVAAITVVLVWSSVFACVSAACYRRAQQSFTSSTATSQPPARTSNINWVEVVSLILLTLCDIAVIGGINIAYQFVSVHYFAWFLGVFKGLWNSHLLPQAYMEVLVWSRQFDSDNFPPNVDAGGDAAANDCSQFKGARETKPPRADTLFQCMVVFNVMVMPVVAVLLLEADCFGYLFVLPPNITSTYSFVVNEYIDLMPMSVSVSYQPPFEYNYRCSNTFVQRYATVFVVSAQSGLVMLVLHYLARVDPRGVFGKEWLAAMSPIITLDPDVCPFSSLKFSNSFLSLSCTLLSIGFMYPPLGVVLCVAILVETFRYEVDLGRYLEGAGDDAMALDERRRIIDKATSGVSAAMLKGLWMLTFPCGAFWGFFVFEMLGSRVHNVTEAIWAPIIIASLPAAGWLVGSMVKHARRGCFGKRELLQMEGVTQRDSVVTGNNPMTTTPDVNIGNGDAVGNSNCNVELGMKCVREHGSSATIIAGAGDGDTRNSDFAVVNPMVRHDLHDPEVRDVRGGVVRSPIVTREAPQWDTMTAEGAARTTSLDTGGTDRPRIASKTLLLSLEARRRFLKSSFNFKKEREIKVGNADGTPRRVSSVVFDASESERDSEYTVEKIGRL